MSAMMTSDGVLRTKSNGKALLYDALAATFVLESLLPEDEARLETVCAMILDWFGAELRHSWGSPFAHQESFSAEHLEYLSCRPARLRMPELLPDPDLSLQHARHRAKTLDNFNLLAHGGRNTPDASPFNVQFFSVIPPPATAEGEFFQTASMLFLTVPRAWPLDDFRRRVLAIASTLRLRWGNAGLSYGSWEHDDYVATTSALFGHSSRFPGYDVVVYAPRLVALWHERIRSVSWLTLLGPSFRERLRAHEALPATNDLVIVDEMGDAIVLQAGDAPEPGDVNRLDVPMSYRRADQMVRPVRARAGNFSMPWDERTTEEWLTRFELIV